MMDLHLNFYSENMLCYGGVSLVLVGLMPFYGENVYFIFLISWHICVFQILALFEILLLKWFIWLKHWF